MILSGYGYRRRTSRLFKSQRKLGEYQKENPTIYKMVAVDLKFFKDRYKRRHYDIFVYWFDKKIKRWK